MQSPSKPTFIIIGSAKCGTTALASILASHPDCCMSRPKEVSFFQDTIDFQPNPNYEKGWEWYKKAFAHYAGESVVGEATPSYSDRSRSPNTAKRIYEFNPDMKIIYMVRNPFQRQVSGWKMQYAFGKEKSSLWRREHQWALKGFDYWMQMQQDAGQWDECCYSYQLAAYQEFFPPRNICVSFLEDWKHSKEIEVKRIMVFLGLDGAFSFQDASVNENRGVDRTIERPVLKGFRNSSIARSVINLFPSGFRSWTRQHVARRKINAPEAKCMATTQQEFHNYLKKDVFEFYRRFGREIDCVKYFEKGFSQ